jgi:hypothetical protein
MGIKKEREEFEKWAFQASEGWASFVKSHGDNYENDKLQFAWKAWKAKSKAVPKWISVDEQEPECGETVLICWSDALDVDPEMDFMDIDVETGAYYWSNCEVDKPTHWMPLPKMIEAQEQSHD